MNRLFPIAAVLLLCCVAPVRAVTTTYAGNFGDPANTALLGSDLLAPQFADANAISENVAVYSLIVPVSELVSFTSTAFALGGADPYFSLFNSVADGGQFLASNYAQAFSTGGDFSYSATLGPGTYLMALGVFGNLSYAENLGSGSFSDGFVALGSPASLNNGAYAVDVTMAISVPEPARWQLLAAGLLAGIAVAWRRRSEAR